MNEPLQIKWHGGVVSAGYLGQGRWRCCLPSGFLEFENTEKAIDSLFGVIFTDVCGDDHDAWTLTFTVGQWTFCLAAKTMPEGWYYQSGATTFDIGDRSKLLRWCVTLFKSSAHKVWADGSQPNLHPPLSSEFSLMHFQSDPDASARAGRLAAVLNVRLEGDLWPPSVLENAVIELRTLGHVLFSWDPFYPEWGCNYMQPSKGRTLWLKLDGWWGDELDDEELLQIVVRF